MEANVTRHFTEEEKRAIKVALAANLSVEPEVRRIVVFGSFVTEANPHDLDVAVFQDSGERYLPLARRYRRRIRAVTQRIPVDVVPLQVGVQDDPFLCEIDKGEVIYER